MQASPPAKRSRWGRRLLIVGGILFGLGTILLFSQSSVISDIFDPRENHEAMATGETIEELVLEDNCYRFYQLSGDPLMEVTLKHVDGSAIVGEAIQEAKCLQDFQTMSGDGTEFVEVASWNLNNEGKYALQITCQENCDDINGWLMSIDSAERELFQSEWLMLGGAMCCLGILILPLGLILHLATKSGRAPRVMMVNADGTLVPITDLTPHTIQQMQEQQTQDPLPLNQDVAPPFADTVEQRPSEDFVDGLDDVKSGHLLTTEQVFALMKGDVEGAQERARNERFQDENPEQVFKQAANSAAIHSWDEGAEMNSDTTKLVSEHTGQKMKSTSSSIPKAPDHAWKDWDDL